MSVIAAAVVLAGWASAAAASLLGPSRYPVSFLIVGLLSTGLGAIAAMTDLRTGVHRAGLRAAVALSLVVAVAHPWLVTVGTPDRYPALFHLLALVACVGAVAYGVRAGAVLGAGWGVVFAVVRHADVGGWQAAAEGVVASLDVLICVVVVSLLRRASAQVEVGVQRFELARVEQEQLSVAVSERSRWDRVLHDKVLGAFVAATAAAPNPAAAAQLAKDALAHLNADLADDTATAERLDRVAAATAARFALVGDIEIDDAGFKGVPPLPLDVRAALAGAVTEAIANVSRHSGQRHVTVRGRVSASGAHLRVIDSGRGFDVARIPPGHAGFSAGIVGRMASVGGTAHVDTEPGHGATVSLYWSADAEPARRDPMWRMGLFGPVVAIGLGMAVVDASIGMSYLSRSTLPVLAVAGAATLIALTVVAVVLARDSRCWLIVPIMLPVVPITLTANLTHHLPVDWQYWFLGAIAPPAAAISFKFQARSGPAAVVASYLGVFITGCVTGHPSPVPYAVDLASSLTPSFAAAAGAVGLRSALEHFTDAFSTATQEESAAKMAAAAWQIRLNELGRRQHDLSTTVGPALVRLQAGTPLTSEGKRALQLVEGAARDSLLAPTVVTLPGVAVAVEHARGRGARVGLSGTDGGDHQALAAFGVLLVDAAERCAADFTLEAAWHPNQDPLGSIALIGPFGAAAEATADNFPRHPELSQTIGITHDDGSVLVVIHAVDPGTGASDANGDSNVAD